MLDRKTPPTFKTLQHLEIPQLHSTELSNKVRCHFLNAGVQEVFKLEAIFPAGSYYEKKAGVAYFTVKMLGEGTQHKNSAQISEAIDQLGGFIEFNHGLERLSITVMGISRYLEDFFLILEELLLLPSFPAQELPQLQSITAQNLQVNLEKNAYLASVKFRELLFGKTHPYGKSLNTAQIYEVNTEDLQSHYQTYLYQKPFDLILVGNYQEKQFERILERLATWKILPAPQDKPLAQAQEVPPSVKHYLLSRPDKLQSSIRTGRHLFTKAHPDYFKVALLNEILGGYYGSRLMKNIREDKGYTYGIYSQLAMFKRGGYWIIGTDVKKELTQKTLDEIAFEIQRLQNDLVSEEELQTVRNYMSGAFAGTLNTAFELAELFKTIYFNQLSYDFYSQYLEQIHRLSAEEIRLTAQKYLNLEDFIEVVVGDK